MVENYYDLLRVVMDGTTDAVFVKDLSGRYLMVNRAGALALGKSVEDVVGKDDTELFRAEDARQLMEEDRKITASGETYTTEDTKTSEGGDTRTYLVTKGPYRDDMGNIAGMFGISRDITERKALEERLAHQALHDPLTGLANRTLLSDRLEQALARAERRETGVALLFIDLDNFKYVNDSLGHEAGDRLLVLVAARLKGCARPEDTLARLGGDEFTLLLEGLEDIEDVRRVGERVMEVLHDPLYLPSHLPGRELFAWASIGITFSEAGGQEGADVLLRQADLALYDAKWAGKARYAVFDPATEIRSIRRLRLENDLRRAMEHDEFVVYYQPLVSLKSGRVVGAEALVRWEHPQRGLVSPQEFVPVAEEIGLIIPLGRWVLHEACRQMREWNRQRRYRSQGQQNYQSQRQERYPHEDRPLIVGVNLSGRQLQGSDVIKDVQDALRESGLEPDRLTLEVTESVLVEDAQRHIDTLQKLRDLGVLLAIDDFGTGYSSLSYLKRLPAGMLKVAGPFVEGIGQGSGDEISGDEILLSGVIAIAQNLGLSVAAEGVETTEQVTRLRELGCDLAQGYYFSGPLPVQQATHFLTHDEL